MVYVRYRPVKYPIKNVCKLYLISLYYSCPFVNNDSFLLLLMKITSWFCLCPVYTGSKAGIFLIVSDTGKDSFMNKKRHLLQNITVLNAAALGGLYLINRHVKKAGLAKNLLRPETGHFYNWKYGQVFYHVQGTGRTPLLLIHDAGAYFSGQDWIRIQNGLLKNYTVYTIDLPGCGRSDKPAMTYTNYFYVRLIHDFIADVIGEKTLIAAAGISSSFALMASIEEPSQISGLIMVDPVHPKKLAQVPGRRSRAVKTLLSLPIIGEAIYHMLTSKQNTEFVLEEKRFFNPFRLTQKMIHSAYESAHSGKGSGRFLLASLDGRYLNWNINRALSICKVPVSLVFGEKAENAAQIEAAYIRLNPDIKAAAVADAGAMPYLENPNLFLSAFSQAAAEK